MISSLLFFEDPKYMKKAPLSMELFSMKYEIVC